MRAAQQWRAFLTLLGKEVGRVFRIWTQTLLPSAITMTLYFVIFGSFIGDRIQDMQGHSYVAFIVPGLIMMAVLTNSYANVSSSFFGNKFQKSIEELLVSPMPSWLIVAGYTAGGMARGLIVGAIVTAISLFFVPLQVHAWSVIVVFVVLTSAVFSLAGLLNGIYARKFDDVSIVPTFVLTPLTYLGGVFYSVTLLPLVWQQISRLNPILYMVNGFRYGFLGISDVPVAGGLMILITLCLGLLVLDVYLIEKGVRLKS
ncbi:ABC transporter permease [Candidatus Woesearchaeota archaeon CG1_02_57_44]|nr:MAG: ABC transporter permease [Candidatus Woesearchaeota archaeon CG1_02_57_44]PIN68381.1 MAG: ABC transporter permease [Candidatus Woesearchaeota archaeon CG11_big_fil_rev_8_21_14_0_20_57_5]